MNFGFTIKLPDNYYRKVKENENQKGFFASVSADLSKTCDCIPCNLFIAELE